MLASIGVEEEDALVLASIRVEEEDALVLGIGRGRKPYPLDANGNKIRPEKENKETGQTQKKSKK